MEDRGKLNERFHAVRRKARRKEKDAGTTEDPKLYLEEAALERQLPELDLRMLVDLPPGLDYNEWLASHTLALFDHINLIYGTISEFCTMTGCPDMTGPGLRCVDHVDRGTIVFKEINLSRCVIFDKKKRGKDRER